MEQTGQWRRPSVAFLEGAEVEGGGGMRVRGHSRGPPPTGFGSGEGSGLARETEGPGPSVGVLGHLELFMTNMENISQIEEQSPTTNSEA